ncbi:MAG: hypothetical protein JRC68_10155, partial [Deltaproteobacteria bacterium]|nr:hypothetical protein [Deltaproteobacteria bacterium]
MYQGYIKTWRKVLASDMYRALTASQRDVFWSCLLLANHHVKEWEWQSELFKCVPGQFITSLANLKALCAPDTSIQNIRTSLVKLEKWQFLTNKSTKTGRLITIINWGHYQGDENKLTKQSTKNQQSSNKALTTNKNDKNVKKEKNKEKKERKKERFTPPKVEDVVLYFISKGYTEKTARKAFDYYNEADWHDSKGNKVKNWKQKMIANWFKDDNKPELKARNF